MFDQFRRLNDRSIDSTFYKARARRLRRKDVDRLWRSLLRSGFRSVKLVADWSARAIRMLQAYRHDSRSRGSLHDFKGRL
jgi:hypothetical protein